MKPFLYETAESLINKHQNNFDKIALVFPNKRAGLFFIKYYSQISGRETWSPNILSIESLLAKFTGLTQVDDLTLIYHLYLAYIKHYQPENPNSVDEYSFDRFYSLGEILLRDFNEIDGYLADAKRLFTLIKDLGQIDVLFESFTEKEKNILREFWKSFSTEQTSIEKQKFLELWSILPNVYQTFTSSLLSKQIAYNGLMYRHLANLIDQDKLETGEFQSYIFIGFNALNKSQEKLFKHLNKRGKAEFYWDTDKYYFDNENQEAGLFLRENLKTIGLKLNEIDVPSNFNNPNKNIELIGVPLQAGQAKIAAHLLEKWKVADCSECPTEKTAIVLADESLLFPVLNSVPDSISKLNVTMGYPLKDTSLFALIDQFLKLHQHALSFQKNQGKKDADLTFYFSDILSVLRNQYIWNKEKELSGEIIKLIEDRNKVYLSSNYLLQKKSEIFDLLFEPFTENHGIDLINRLLDLLPKLQTGSDEKNLIENEYIYFAYTQLNRLQTVVEENLLEIGFFIAQKLIKQHLQTAKIPFDGEPLQGLQILGLMETRNIDFENVILLSANEGTLPNINRQPTFISENLRYVFGLPQIVHIDAIYSYLFYRLIQRAKNIAFVYNNVSSSNISSEVSRFIQQIQYESGLNIKQSQQKQVIVPTNRQEIVIQKSPEIAAILSKYEIINENCERRFSASAINCYLDCSLKFFYHYIAQINELTEVNEEIDAAEFGTILHHALEKLYVNFIKHKNSKTIESTDIDVLKTLVGNAVETAFKIQFDDRTSNPFEYSGNQHIIREVVKKHANNILEVDRKQTPFEMVSLEDNQEFFGFAVVKTGKGKRKIGLKGIIDRIDKKNDVVRVVDYKTGAVDKEIKSLENLFNREIEDRNAAFMQTLFYTMLYYQRAQKPDIKIIPALYDIRKMNSSDFTPYLSIKTMEGKIPIASDNYKHYMYQFHEILAETIDEILDLEIPFSQTALLKKCGYCPYISICNR